MMPIPSPGWRRSRTAFLSAFQRGEFAAACARSWVNTDGVSQIRGRALVTV